jgi:hypothetical protein
MIDYYSDKSLKCENRIEECLQYYLSKNFLKYDDIYEEYDRINARNPKIDTNEKNIFFNEKRKNKAIIPRTNFMKECLLESLKRLVDKRTIEESKNKESDLNKESKDYMIGSQNKDDHFIYYPDIYEENIPDKLFAKEELRRHIVPDESGTIKDKCDSQFFELAPHQLFLKNLISPNTHYYGLLIFHGVGVGKSCSGISIAENFRDIYGKEENKIIILASENIRIGWRKTIFDPSKGDNQCTGDDYYYEDEGDNHITDGKYAKKTIKKYYELRGYAAFANSVKKMLNEGCRHITDEKELLKNKIKLIKDKYSNRVLIIDEVHNIRSDENQKEGRDTIHYIEMVIKYSDKLRLILLTANPMYNLSTEIVWILNMLLLNDKKPIIMEKKIFDKEGNLINEDLLKDKSKGYISYLRGENPISFPVRLYPKHDLKRIIKKPKQGSPDLRPTNDIFYNELNEETKLSFLELYSSALKDKQLEIYMNECIKNKGPKLQIDVENILLQLSNVVYPGESESYGDLYGETGLLNTMNHDKNIYSYQKDTLSSVGEYFHKDLIGNYSSKIKSILDTIGSSDGIIFIYSNWISSGVIPMVLALEQNGYTKFDGKEVLKGSKKIEKISVEGKSYSEYSDKKEFKKANYMVIAGSGIGSSNLEEELKIVTSDENKEGHKIKIIIGSSVAAEGLDFKNIRNIHILEPWHNINKLEQVIGRGIRNCSHKKLDECDRNVTVYLHTSTVPDRESIDMYLYRYSEYKAKQIGQIENILKKNALDKYVFQHGNYFDEQDVDKIKVKPSHRKTKGYLHDRSDKEYSRVCSFSKICDYMKNDKKESISIPDINEYDTFQINYSSSLTDVYKKRIHNLYLKSVSYTFDELKDSLSMYKEIYSDYLYHAIKEMISEKYTLHNSNGDKGYLVRVDKYYLFQPYYNNDILLPTYYRLNKGDTNHIEYEIKKKEKKINTFLYEKHIFNEERINATFEKIVSFVFKDHEYKVFDYLGMKGLNEITISYLFDRLSIDDKLVIGYSVLLYLKEKEIIFDEVILNHLVTCFEKLFIYYDGTKYYYRDNLERGKEKDIVGFFLYHNSDKKPLYYNYVNREIEIFNKVDEIDIVRIIKANRGSKSLSVKGSWGFLTYSERIKYGDPRYTHNGIVLKVIKSSDKLKKSYVYPTGPGIIIQDQATGAWIGESTYQFIIDEFQDIFDSLSESNKATMQSKNAKRDYVCFIECCLRMKKLCIQNDLIFMKYY